LTGLLETTGIAPALDFLGPLMLAAQLLELQYDAVQEIDAAHARGEQIGKESYAVNAYAEQLTAKVFGTTYKPQYVAQGPGYETYTHNLLAGAQKALDEFATLTPADIAAIQQKYTASAFAAQLRGAGTQMH